MHDDVMPMGKDGRRIPHTMDALTWADYWMEMTKDNPGIATDRDTMVSWFANAIMAGFDNAVWRGIPETKQQ